MTGSGSHLCDVQRYDQPATHKPEVTPELTFVTHDAVESRRRDARRGDGVRQRLPEAEHVEQHLSDTWWSSGETGIIAHAQSHPIRDVIQPELFKQTYHSWEQLHNQISQFLQTTFFKKTLA